MHFRKRKNKRTPQTEPLQNYIDSEVIYDPSDDPIMQKKRKEYLKEFKRGVLKLKIYMTIVLSLSIFVGYLSLMVESVSKFIPIFLMAVIVGLLALGILYLPIKGKYQIKSTKIILFEDGILYDSEYRPRSNSFPNPLFIPYKDIRDMSIDTLKSGRRVIHIKLQGKSAEIREDMEDWVSVLEDFVPDIEEFYKILEEQIERNRKE